MCHCSLATRIAFHRSQQARTLTRRYAHLSLRMSQVNKHDYMYDANYWYSK